MSVRFGLDSTSEISTGAHHAVGSSVAIRYLGHSTPKVVTKREHMDLIAAGIDLYLVFEDGGRPDLSDYAGGKANAEFALKQATDILGVPRRPYHISFAWDTDPSPNVAAADGYYDGVGAVLGGERSGPYGGYPGVVHLANRGFHNLYQTYAWSFGRWDPRSRVRQFSSNHTVGGVGCDFDHIIPGPGGDFGQVDFRPIVVSIYHYWRFPNILWETPWGKLSERHVVFEYDGARKHPDKYKNYLHLLEAQLNWFAQRAWYEAHHGQVLGWGPFWRWWRWPELHNRSRGQQIAH